MAMHAVRTELLQAQADTRAPAVDRIDSIPLSNDAYERDGAGCRTSGR